MASRQLHVNAVLTHALVRSVILSDNNRCASVDVTPLQLQKGNCTLVFSFKTALYLSQPNIKRTLIQ